MAKPTAWKIRWDKQTRIHLLKLVGIAVLYVAAAKLGLSLAVSTQQVTTVWPPAGLALVVTLLWGYKYLPGIFVGAFVVNLFTNEPALVALGIAIGNTLEAWIGATILIRIVKFKNSFENIWDVIGFVVGAGLMSTVVAATIGALSLTLGGIVGWQHVGRVWLTWWTGDMMGDLIFGPFLLAFVSHQLWRTIRQKPVEVGMLMALIFAASMVVFTSNTKFLPTFSPVAYMIFPFVTLVAFRLTQVGVAMATVVIAGTAIWATTANMGPFVVARDLEANLVFLQLFIFIVSVTSMLLAVTVAERNRTEQELRDRTTELHEANERITNILAGMLDDEA